MPQSPDQQHQLYLDNGWCLFEFDPLLQDWVQATLPAALKAVDEPANQQWLRHGNTWFAGVNALVNDASGKVHDGLPLQGKAIEFVLDKISAGRRNLDKAQVSVCYPGYPLPSNDEPDTAFGFRLRRDAAHVDGLLAEGPDKKRFLREHHAFVLGIAMTEFSADAAPLVMWKGSHKLVQSAFRQHLGQTPVESWAGTELTDVYKNVRRQIFNQCERIEVALTPGQAIVAHRLVLHGTAPWNTDAVAGPHGRMICFFRPPGLTANRWLNNP